ncbi:MAG: hypothetical protein SOT71_12450 [Romboutsia timonensis]|uniref:hypothetical protein n=1 Tax=Romboutsia timonensis TaxID=1776391 RepID=UPI002A74FE14|nr:hypothetical protein [Romboutsia timonensis]MDY2883451.1 hypothetical protein [Romboutsia timonensis]
MINSKIIQALEPLNIPVYWMNYDGNDAEYIIFQTNSQKDIRFTDDTADAESSDIGLIFWFNTPSGASRIQQIKDLMKANNFIKISERDMYDKGYYGRTFSFRYVKDFVI